MKNNTDKKDLLVTLADRNYIQQAKQLFSSVYWNAGWKGDYMLLSHDIPEKELKWFRDKGILVKKLKPLYNKEIGIAEIRNPAVLSKFYLFTPEFRAWKNIVFLEGDIIVRASLDYFTELKGFYATDAEDRPRLCNQLVNDDNLYNELKRHYNLHRRSFNPGVMIFSSDIIKDDDFSSLMSLFSKYGNLSNCGEEGILNLFLYNKWKKLPYVYNIWTKNIVRACKIKEYKIKGIIFHFISTKGLENFRPWDEKNIFYNEWKTNLDRAELIDLTEIQKARKWSPINIWFYSLYLGLRFFIFTGSHERLIKLSKPKKAVLAPLFLSFIGQTGIFIKKLNPAFYYKLKKIKDGKNEKQH